MTAAEGTEDAVLLLETDGGGVFTVAAAGGAAAPSALSVGARIAEGALAEALTRAAVPGGGEATVRLADGATVAVTPLSGAPGAPVRLLCRYRPAPRPGPGPGPGPDPLRWPGFFQTLIDAVPVPIFVKDAGGRYVYCNAAFGVFNGRPAAAYIGRTVFDIAPDELAQVYQAADNALFDAGGDQIYEARVRRPDGNEAEVVFYKSVFTNPHGETGGIIGAILDLSAVRAAERALRQASSDAERANRMKSQFLVTMSHELRTPLNAILGFSEVIKDQLCGPVGHRYADYAADIHTAGEHLLSLINDILDLSKIEAGRMELDAMDLDLPALLAGALRLVLHRAQSGRVSLRLDISDPPPRLRADERAVKQMLVNLLGNAVKFTPERGRVVLSAAPDSWGCTVISVTDTGPGIPADHLERIMRPFERMDNRYGHADGGTGLGMALVKALADLHGASVFIDSAPGRGTCVAIRFPPPP